MGIRESLREQPDALSLKDLTMPEEKTEQGFEFDVEKEISEEDWEKINQLFVEKVSQSNWHEVLAILKDVAILHPERARSFEINSTNWQKIEEAAQNEKNLDWDTFTVFYLVQLKLLKPEILNRIVPDKNLTFEKMKNDLAGFYESTGIYLYLAQACEMKILIPEKEDRIGITKPLWQEMETDLKKFKRERDWFSLINAAMEMKIISPKKFKEINISKKTWQEMKNESHESKAKGHWMNFIAKAAGMKILAAQEVRITDQGLELIMPEKKESHRQTLPPRPERRNF